MARRLSLRKATKLAFCRRWSGSAVQWVLSQFYKCHQTRLCGRVGRLLVSELYTVGAGGWSGFPSHKHDTDRLPLETRHDEAYNFRFNPPHGSGLQMLQRADGQPGDAYHLVDGSTVAIDTGYHPCCVLPGYEMYYFTILGGLSQRSLVQYFQPSHAGQIETIPGIKDMIAKFK